MSITTNSPRKRRRSLNLPFVVAALMLLAALVGCRSRSPLVQEVRTTFPEDQNPDTASSAPGLDIYIDGSGSMQGFVTTPDSNFKEAIGDLVLFATQNRFDLRVFRFSSGVELVKGQTINVVQNAGFYNGADTPLASLLTQIGGHTGRTAVVVSDLVLSSRSEDSQKLVQALAALASQRPQIKLLGYRSNFKGRYHSERSGQNYPLTATQGVPSAGRPFYMLVVAPNAASMEKAQKDVLDRLQIQPETFFDATSQAFTIQGATLGSSSVAKDAEWITVSKYAVRNKESDRFETAYRLAQDPTADTVDLPVTLTYAESVPLSRADHLSLEGEIATFSKTSRSGAGPQRSTGDGWGFSAVNKTAIPFRGEMQQKDGKSQMRLALNLKKPQRNQWDVYRIKVRPGEGNLKLPEWAEKWSTDDDSDVANGNKTYLLRLLVGTMESSITQERVCAEWILRVGGKE